MRIGCESLENHSPVGSFCRRGDISVPWVGVGVGVGGAVGRSTVGRSAGAGTATSPAGILAGIVFSCDDDSTTTDGTFAAASGAFNGARTTSTEPDVAAGPPG